MTRQISFGGGILEAPEPRYMRQRAMADALLQGTQGPINGWGQGVANLAKTAAAGFIGRRADEAQHTESAARAQALKDALASSDPLKALGDSSDLELQSMGLQYQMAQAIDPSAKWHTLSDDEEKAAGLDTSGVYQGNTAGQVQTVQAPIKPAEDPSAVREYQYAVEHDKYPGTYTDWVLEQKKAGAASTTNNVTLAGDKKNAETLGDYYGGKLGKILDAGFDAPKTIAQYQQLGSLLDQAGSGTFTGTGADIKKAVKGMLGEDAANSLFAAAGVNDNTAAVDAARSIANELTLQMRNPSGGAGMPGAMSDSDRNFLSAIPPNVGNTPGGNAQIIKWRVKMAQRDQDVAKLARDYAKNHGKIIDDGFFDELQQWSDAHPLFDANDAAVVSTMAGAAPAADQGEVPTATGPNGAKLYLRNGQWVPQ